MAIQIRINAAVPERGTAFPLISFFDEAGVATTPTAATWTLTDSLGVVVNGRSAVTISPLSTTVTLVLHDLDLAVGTGLFGVERKLLIQATYDSTHGTGLSLNAEITFTIADFVKPSGIT